MNKHFFQSHNIEVSIISFSPEQARKILNSINIGNRKISESRVNEYKKDMEAGNWRFNGDAIRIDENGILIDGQHRMQTVVTSGMDCEFLVIKGIRSDSKHTIDTGKGRTGGDALSIQAGVPFLMSHMISGALSLFEKYKSSGFCISGGGIKLSTSQILKSYDNRKDLINYSISVMDESMPKKGLLLPKSYVLFLLMVFSEIDRVDAKNYMNKIITGAEVTNGSVELHVRNIMLDVKMGNSKMNRKILINSILKCWNTIRRGSNIKLIVYGGPQRKSLL